MNTGPLTVEENRALRAPFPKEAVKQRQGRGNASFSYITARDVMDRLDDVVGPSDWFDEYRVVDAEHVAVECRLTVRGVTRADVGYPNNPEWDDDREPEKLKAAYSDAFKRAAVKWGIGRFLYGGASAAPSAPASGVSQPQQHPNLLRASEEANREARAVANRIPPAPNHTGNGGGPVLPATEPQLRAIYAIGRAKQAMDDAEVEARCKELYGVTPSALSRRQASELIDWINKQG